MEAGEEVVSVQGTGRVNGELGEEMVTRLLREGWAGPKRQHRDFRQLQPTLKAWSENQGKNRDPLCPLLDHSRVLLTVTKGGPKNSDYIHASWINRTCLQPFILTQLPLAGGGGGGGGGGGRREDTRGDFWRLVWQEEVRVILSLLDMDVEAPEESYFPLRTQTKEDYEGGWMVENSSAEGSGKQIQDVRLRTLFLHKRRPEKGEEKTRRIVHLSYLRWPIKAELMSPPDSLLGCVEAAEEENQRFSEKGANHAPILIHCWNGGARSGAAVALTIGADLLRNTKEQAIAPIVADIRLRRHGALNSPHHYLFLHRRLLQFALHTKPPLIQPDHPANPHAIVSTLAKGL